jgi:hypothetical protein
MVERFHKQNRTMKPLATGLSGVGGDQSGRDGGAF